MNKRIKFKKGLLQKKCDNKCNNYKNIVRHRFITNNSCIGCKFRDKAYELLCKENQKFIEETNKVKVYRMNDYEWWASRWDIEKTNKFYLKDTGLDEEENPTEDIVELNIDKYGMWAMTGDKEDINKIGDSEEVMYKDQRGKIHFGSLKRMGDEVFKYISFREAIGKDLEFTEPYCIASTEY